MSECQRRCAKQRERSGPDVRRYAADGVRAVPLRSRQYQAARAQELVPLEERGREDEHARRRSLRRAQLQIVGGARALAPELLLFHEDAEVALVHEASCFAPFHVTYRGFDDLREGSVDTADVTLRAQDHEAEAQVFDRAQERIGQLDRKSTRLNSSHVKISYAVLCLKKKIPAY